MDQEMLAVVKLSKLSYLLVGMICSFLEGITICLVVAFYVTDVLKVLTPYSPYLLASYTMEILVRTLALTCHTAFVLKIDCYKLIWQCFFFFCI